MLQITDCDRRKEENSLLDKSDKYTTIYKSYITITINPSSTSMIFINIDFQVWIQDLVKGAPASEAKSCQHSEASNLQLEALSGP